MKRKLLFISGFVLLALALYFAFTLNRTETNTDEWKSILPHEAVDAFENYMSAAQKGVDQSVDYIYFADDFVRDAYLATEDRMLDYQVVSAEKINDSLYEVTVLGNMEKMVEMGGDPQEEAFYFIAFIDGKWILVGGINNIPETLRQNLDMNKYRYHDENIVDGADVLGMGLDEVIVIE